jgi:hypothetical protein
MDQPYCRQQADRCRRLAHYSTDPATRVDLLRMGDEFQMVADEIENDEIIFAERKKSGSTTARAIAKGAMQGEFALHAQGKARRRSPARPRRAVVWRGGDRL